MTHKPDDIRVGDWQLERYRLGELPGHEAAALERLAEQDQTLRERLAALGRSDAAILAEHPPRLAVAQIRVRLAAVTPAPQRHRAWLAAWRPALGAVAAVLVVGAVLWRLPGQPSEDTNRIKGLTPQLLLFRQAVSSAEPLTSGSAARAHDVVQLAYQAAGQRYGVILSIDGRGVLTRHLPPTGSEAARLEAGAPTPLPEAYELDDAPRWECFFFVTADRPFPVERVVAAARTIPRTDTPPVRLSLPKGLVQSSFVLRKEPLS
jgi:hypothetical protein